MGKGCISPVAFTHLPECPESVNGKLIILKNPINKTLGLQGKKGAKMTNKEWLEERKTEDERLAKQCDEKDVNFIDALDNRYLQHRQAKGLEIIAEELIKLNETIHFVLLHRDIMGLRKIFVEAFGEEEVKKAEKANEEKTKIQN